MESTNQIDKPTAVLKSEHQVILRVLAVLRRLIARYESGEGFEHEAAGRCVEFFRLFADACHHAKEEDLLFPALESCGMPRDQGPIGVMLYEHQVGRQLTRDMGEALDAHGQGDADAARRWLRAAGDYVELLTNHIAKEDDILFVMSDRMLPDQTQSTLCSKFCEVGCQRFGGKSREELEQLATKLESDWPASG